MIRPFAMIAALALTGCDPAPAPDSAAGLEMDPAPIQPIADMAEDEPVAPAADLVAEAPEVAAATDPGFDMIGYCRTIGDTAGGSAMIEKACRDMESQARGDMAGRAVPDRTRRYCTTIGETAGGSYQIYKACVDQELEAAAAL